MAEYIDRERIRKAIVGACLMNQNCPMFIAATIDQMIDCQPAANVAPVVHGRWVVDVAQFQFLMCSSCGTFHYTGTRSTQEANVLKSHWYNYCPNCGAKMDEEEHNNV